LIIQGTNDQAVKMEEFDLLKKHLVKQKAIILEANHVLGRFTSLFWYRITRAYQELVKVTKNFLIVSICFMGLSLS
jgi:hypothetical protein